MRNSRDKFAACAIEATAAGDRLGDLYGSLAAELDRARAQLEAGLDLSREHLANINLLCSHIANVFDGARVDLLSAIESTVIAELPFAAPPA